MAANELLPFANGGDANVLPIEQWQALTDILENGFQSGIARSEQVNRVLAQGAVASYVLGQLVVDRLDSDANLNPTTLYQNVVLALQQIGVQTGMVVAMSANEAPNGYLFCNGAEVSRTTYADLFAKIGTLYGEGDGSTTFNIPELRNRFIQGGVSGTVKEAGLPNVTGTLNGNDNVDNQFLFDTYSGITSSGALYLTGKMSRKTIGNGSSTTAIKGFGIDASKSSSIYGNSTTVQPPALTMRFYIKY